MKYLLIGPAGLASLSDLQLGPGDGLVAVSSFKTPEIENPLSSTAFRAWAHLHGPDHLKGVLGPWDDSQGPDTVLVAFSAGGAGVDELLGYFAPYQGTRLHGVVLADGLFLSLPFSLEQRKSTVSYGQYCADTKTRFLIASSSSNAGPNITSGSFALKELMGAVGAEGSPPPDWPLVPPPLTYRAPSAPVWGLDYQQTLGATPKKNHENHINYVAARAIAGIGSGVLKPGAAITPPMGGSIPLPNIPPDKGGPKPLPPAPVPAGTLYTWFTKDGLVRVQKNGEGPFAALEIAPPDKTRWDRTTAWLPLVKQVLRENKIKLPIHWVMGTIYVESGGDADAVGKTNGERGLMQVIPNGTASDTFGFGNPEYGILRGSTILEQYNHLDLPAAVSCYNGGPAKGKTPFVPKKDGASPWGYVETAGHIEKVVRAANSFRMALGDGKSGGGSGGILLLGALGLGLYAFGRR